MRHDIAIEPLHGPVPYRAIGQGTIFQCQNPQDEGNIYMKVGTRAFSLRTGMEYSYDQNAKVVPLKTGTIITLVIAND